MTKEEFVEKLNFQITDIKDIIEQSGAVRSSLEQDLLSENDAIGDQVSLVYSLIQKSEAIGEMVDDFLNTSPTNSRELVEQANQIVSEAKAEIARFQENKAFEDLDDVTDETGSVQ